MRTIQLGLRLDQGQATPRPILMLIFLPLLVSVCYQSGGQRAGASVPVRPVKYGPGQVVDRRDLWWRQRQWHPPNIRDKDQHDDHVNEEFLNTHLMPLRTRRAMNRQFGITRSGLNLDFAVFLSREPESVGGVQLRTSDLIDWILNNLIKLLIPLLTENIPRVLYCTQLVLFGTWRFLSASQFPYYCCILDIFKLMPPCRDDFTGWPTTPRPSPVPSPQPSPGPPPQLRTSNYH